MSRSIALGGVDGPRGRHIGLASRGRQGQGRRDRRPHRVVSPRAVRLEATRQSVPRELGPRQDLVNLGEEVAGSILGAHLRRGRPFRKLVEIVHAGVEDVGRVRSNGVRVRIRARFTRGGCGRGGRRDGWEDDAGRFRGCPPDRRERGRRRRELRVAPRERRSREARTAAAMRSISSARASSSSRSLRLASSRSRMASRRLRASRLARAPRPESLHLVDGHPPRVRPVASQGAAPVALDQRGRCIAAEPSLAAELVSAGARASRGRARAPRWARARRRPSRSGTRDVRKRARRPATRRREVALLLVHRRVRALHVERVSRRAGPEVVLVLAGTHRHPRARPATRVIIRHVCAENRGATRARAP